MKAEDVDDMNVYPLPTFPVCSANHEGCTNLGFHLHPTRPSAESLRRTSAWFDAVMATGTGDELAERVYQRLMRRQRAAGSPKPSPNLTPPRKRATPHLK